jgi:hypothetical protein
VIEALEDRVEDLQEASTLDQQTPLVLSGSSIRTMPGAYDDDAMDIDSPTELSIP